MYYSEALSLLTRVIETLHTASVENGKIIEARESLIKLRDEWFIKFLPSSGNSPCWKPDKCKDLVGDCLKLAPAEAIYSPEETGLPMGQPRSKLYEELLVTARCFMTTRTQREDAMLQIMCHLLDNTASGIMQSLDSSITPCEKGIEDITKQLVKIVEGAHG